MIQKWFWLGFMLFNKVANGGQNVDAEVQFNPSNRHKKINANKGNDLNANTGNVGLNFEKDYDSPKFGVEQTHDSITGIISEETNNIDGSSLISTGNKQYIIYLLVSVRFQNKLIKFFNQSRRT